MSIKAFRTRKPHDLQIVDLCREYLDFNRSKGLELSPGAWLDHVRGWDTVKRKQFFAGEMYQTLEGFRRRGLVRRVPTGSAAFAYVWEEQT